MLCVETGNTISCIEIGNAISCIKTGNITRAYSSRTAYPFMKCRQDHSKQAIQMCMEMNQLSCLQSKGTISSVLYNQLLCSMDLFQWDICQTSFSFIENVKPSVWRWFQPSLRQRAQPAIYVQPALSFHKDKSSFKTEGPDFGIFKIYIPNYWPIVHST